MPLPLSPLMVAGPSGPAFFLAAQGVEVERQAERTEQGRGPPGGRRQLLPPAHSSHSSLRSGVNKGQGLAAALLQASCPQLLLLDSSAHLFRPWKWEPARASARSLPRAMGVLIAPTCRSLQATEGWSNESRGSSRI